jgi:hypothetical protein
VIFVCSCGRKFKAPEGTPPQGHACPRCGGPLRPAGAPTPGTDVKVLTEQKKALRDELRVRDRQLRIAQAEINRLKAENAKLREEMAHVRGASFVTISEAPAATERFNPNELPSDRLDLSPVPLMEEIAEPADAPQLPSDRLPLFSPTKE